jgi:uncharacterized cupin superfamily protein
VPDWFVVNVADAPAVAHERAGSWARFESSEEHFPDVGLNIHVLQPGQPNAKYHAESVQEDFLVLSGECIAILDGEEHRLGAWDFVHCPAGTAHVFVGAGEAPCAILMVGARRPDATIEYPVDEVAARHGASVSRATSDPAEAYADWSGELTPTRLSWPPA